jgi:hypothetical protein
VPHDHQRGAGDRHQGLELAAELDDRPVPFAKERSSGGTRFGWNSIVLKAISF